jgi:hypothetical protein
MALGAKRPQIIIRQQIFLHKMNFLDFLDASIVTSI